jgi:outer membrane protein assembly factor BamB
MTSLRFGSCVFAFSIGLAVFVGVSVPAQVPKENELTTPSVKWAAKDEFVSNGPHDPLVVNDLVVVGTDKGELRAYRCKDGSPTWTHLHGNRISHCPSSDGKRIYFTSDNGLTAITVNSGSKLWSFDLAFCDGCPTIVPGGKAMVYVGGSDGNIYALDAKTGAERWKSDFIADAPPDPPDFPGERARVGNTLARPSALTSDGETLFLSVFDQCRIVAVNATTGKRIWSFQARGWVFGSAVPTATHVFFGGQDKAFYCLDKKTGKQIWKYETKERIESGGFVDDTFVYFGSCDGYLHCLNQSDGKQRWQFLTDAEPGGTRSAIYSVPLLKQGNICFAAGEGQMYAVDRETGRLKWKIRPSEGSELYCSAATDGTHFFLVTRPRGQEEGEMSLAAIGIK